MAGGFTAAILAREEPREAKAGLEPLLLPPPSASWYKRCRNRELKPCGRRIRVKGGSKAPADTAGKARAAQMCPKTSTASPRGAGGGPRAPGGALASAAGMDGATADPTTLEGLRPLEPCGCCHGKKRRAWQTTGVLCNRQTSQGSPTWRQLGASPPRGTGRARGKTGTR